MAPGGIGSRWFRALAAGAEVRFKAPFGGFVFSRADPRRPLFVAEEIGVVPVRAILNELYETGFGRPAVLASWTRDGRRLVYDAEFRSLARRYPAFSYHPLVGSDDRPLTDAAGDLAALTERIAGDVVGLVAYVAGGERMIHRVRDALVARGMDRKAVKWEKFW